MDFTFTNGTAHQHEVFLGATRSLLNYDIAKAPGGTVEVAFAADPSAAYDDEFAVTEADGSAITIRDDFPRFAPIAQWGSIEFAMETVIHEVGHVILAFIPASVRLELGDLFRIDSFLVGAEYLNENETKAWVDRHREGFAETFKDAFLPTALRAYGNRTNIALPLHRLRSFRKIMREMSVEESGLSFPTPGGFDAYRDGYHYLEGGDAAPQEGEHGLIPGLYASDGEDIGDNTYVVTNAAVLEQVDSGAEVRGEFRHPVLDSPMYGVDAELQARAVFADELVAEPSTQHVLPSIGGARAFGGVPMSVTPGSPDYTYGFAKPVYAYKGVYATVGVGYEFFRTSADRQDYFSNFDWGAAADAALVSSDPVWLAATVPSRPGGASVGYLFSPDPIPIGDNDLCLLELSAAVFAYSPKAEGVTPPTEGEINAVILGMYLGDVIEPQDPVPAGAIGGGGARSGAVRL